MGKRTRTLTVAAVVGTVVSISAPASFAQVPTAGSGLTRTYHVLLTGKARMVVTDALAGAVRRLARPRCQQLFTDFVDPAGHFLSERLAASGKTATEWLADLYFVDGDDAAQCRANETTTAFTAPLSRVIHVCGGQFAERFARKTAGGEILLIHELLHALGLSENPPTSADITDAVLGRCGD
jgi:hypothetical protein